MMAKLGVPYAMMSDAVQEKAAATLLARYGVTNIAKLPEYQQKRVDTDKAAHGGVMGFNTPESYEKRRITVQQRYGGEVLASEEIKQKIHDTMEERYGHRNALQVPEFKAKHQQTVFKHYGVLNPFSSEEVRKKSEQTMLQRYGVTNASQSEELVRKAEQSMLEKHGRCARISKLNMKFSEYLQAHNISHSMEHFLYGKWYDFVLERDKVFIELDPTYTHNSAHSPYTDPLPKEYHLAKTNLAKENGYRCIHLWSWDSWDKILSLVQPRIVIYARQCSLIRVYPDIASKFLEANHLQGSCKGQLVSLGLVFDGQLVQVMSFGRPRYDSKHDVELLRLCSKTGCQIVGGASKLFHFATHYFELHNIVSYCDLSKFTGDVYEKIGMKLFHVTEPQEIWSKDAKFITANLLRQRGFDQLFGTNYGRGTSNEQLMLDHGWLPVYDCGQAVYEFK
ncbi:hypothetical protein [uncultured Duncaniella sp.]|uniref:DUF7487 domain-containing protein n=1 Tax=uncultured Duncaniella sp. TaxID=2768039 RepID=UPI002638E63C|nr:hypothetical protein [uncultured Duncaniella sp.]